MPSVDVINAQRQKVGSLDLSDDLFGEVGSSHVVWEVVRHHLAAQRSGTHQVKTRADVSGGGKKPWKQKGTGRARVGSSRNPLWRHGGITHGPQPRDYDYALPKQKRRVAVRRVIASLLKDQRVTVLDGLNLGEGRSKALKGLVGSAGLPDRALLLVEKADENLSRASANFREYKVALPEGLNAYDLLKFRHLVATRGALTRLQEVLGR